MRSIKVYHKDIFPEPTWINIEDEDSEFNDEEIYFYVDTKKIDLNKLKAGQLMELDHTFYIVEVYSYDKDDY